MDKFLEKIKTDLESKILACVDGQSIVRPFPQIYDEVRKNQHKKAKKIASEFKNESSIYKEVIEKFLKENPEFIKE